MVGLCDPVGPLGAITLNRPVREPTDVIWSRIKRRIEPCEPPLNRSQIGTCDRLGSICLTTDQDEFDPCRTALWVTQGQHS